MNKTAKIRRVTIAGAIINICLSLAKCVVGWVAGSQALIADGVHSFSDLATDVAVLLGAKYWSRPADANHPYGHSRIETLITALIGLALAVVALYIGGSALEGIREKHTCGPSMLAFYTALVSIGSKEWLYRWTRRVGISTNSPAVVANAWHHRSDAFSSIPVAVAVLVSAIFPQWYFVDHIAAVLVAVFILYAAWTIIKPAILELSDLGAGEDIHKQIDQICRNIDGVVDVHDLRSRKTGERLLIDMHLVVDGNLSVKCGHLITEQAETALLSGNMGITDVMVHLEPAGDNCPGKPD